MKTLRYWINHFLESITTILMGKDESIGGATPVPNASFDQPNSGTGEAKPLVPSSKAKSAFTPEQAPAAPANAPLQPLAPNTVAGISVRKKGEQVKNDKIVQNQTNDTVYIQRNEIVKVVYDRYAKFGDVVASAILSKTFLPNGQQLMMARLNIESLGSAMPDHDQIVDWIDENGVEAFCEKLKIRISSVKVPPATAVRQQPAEISQNQTSTVTNAGITPVALNKKSEQ